MAGHVERGPKLCECGCGEPAPIATITNRRSGAIKGHPQRFVPGHHLKGLAAAKRIELTGQRFGRLTALRLTRLRRSVWEVRCDCGAVLHATSQSLRGGKITSCGAPTCSDAARTWLELDCSRYLLKTDSVSSRYRIRCGPLSAADQTRLMRAAGAGTAVRLVSAPDSKIELSSVHVTVIATGWVWIEGTAPENPSG
jgi:hypothetical protein